MKPSRKNKGVTRVGSGDWLGHWLWFNLLVITLAAICISAFVKLLLKSVVSQLRACDRFNLNKLKRGLVAKWALIKYGFGIFIIHLRVQPYNLRILFHQFLMNQKLMLLNLLDEDACLFVLRELDKSGKQLADLRNGFKTGHNNDDDVSGLTDNGRLGLQPINWRGQPILFHDMEV
jgi:hypothetical protein